VACGMESDGTRSQKPDGLVSLGVDHYWTIHGRERFEKGTSLEKGRKV